MITYCVFTLLMGLLSGVKMQATHTGDSSVSCVNYSWFLPGFAPFNNSSWTAMDCSVKCSQHPDCKYWNWREGRSTGCFLKSDISPNPTRRFKGAVLSQDREDSEFLGGYKDCRPGEPCSTESCGSAQGVQQGDKEDSPPDESCVTLFWLLPGFSPLMNSSWTAMDCSEKCSQHPDCKYWNWRQKSSGCFLKSDRRPSRTKGYEGSVFLGGSKDCRPDAPCGTQACQVATKGWGLGSLVQGIAQGVQQGIHRKPPRGQRCAGRNYGSRRCCNPENPCNEGEGDCDGHGDGGQHDGNAGCKGSLVCGSNNCKKFGIYYHEKDDCCERPSSSSPDPSSNGSGPSSESSLFSSESSPEFLNIPHKPPVGQRCSGRNYGKGRCCNPENPCNEGEGDCDGNDECKGSFICGNNNCKKFGTYYHKKDDCCERPSSSSPESSSNGLGSSSGSSSISFESKPGFSNIPDEPTFGQRCSGRNYGQRRCCNPENPCNEGEGDCDGPGDGGQHDGNAGCKGKLVCGSNNCKKFGTYYHEKDDCCERPSSSSSNDLSFSSGSTSNGLGSSIVSSNVPSEPPHGQRCSGRNYGERRCCSPENPCNEGEGDCDGPADGGQHDGHAGCKGSLVCGSNNCKKFGTYYHEKDDCCEKPSSSSSSSSTSGGSVAFDGWSSWGSWSQCNKKCGGGKRSRHRFCSGKTCRHTQQSQERNCNTSDCKGPK